MKHFLPAHPSEHLQSPYKHGLSVLYVMGNALLEVPCSPVPSVVLGMDRVKGYPVERMKDIGLGGSGCEIQNKTEKGEGVPDYQNPHTNPDRESSRCKADTDTPLSPTRISFMAS